MPDAANFGQALDAALTKENENEAVKATQAVFQKIAGDSSLDDVVKRAVEDIWKKDTENRPFAFYNTFFKGKVLGLSNKEREFFDKKIEDSRVAVIQALNGLGVELKNMSTEDIKKSIETIQTNMTSIDERVTSNTDDLANLKTEYESLKKTTNVFNDNIKQSIVNAETGLEYQKSAIGLLNDQANRNSENLKTIDGHIENTRKTLTEIDKKVTTNTTAHAKLITNYESFKETTNAFKDDIEPRMKNVETTIRKDRDTLTKQEGMVTLLNYQANNNETKIDDLSTMIDQIKNRLNTDEVPSKIAQLEVEVEALKKSQKGIGGNNIERINEEIEELNGRITDEITGFLKSYTDVQTRTIDMLDRKEENTTKELEELKKYFAITQNDLKRLKNESEAGIQQNETNIKKWTEDSKTTKTNLEKSKDDIEKLKTTQQTYETNQSVIKANVKRLTDLVGEQAKFINEDLNKKYEEFQKKQTTNFVDFVEFAVRRRDLVNRMKEAIYTIDSETLKDLIVREGDTLYKRNYDELLETFDTKRNDVFSTIGRTPETTRSINDIGRLLETKWESRPSDPVTIA